MSKADSKKKVAILVGIYDTAVGLLPLLSMSAFSSLTGLHDHLNTVRCLGVAWACLGAALLIFHNKPRAVTLLGIASTLAGGSLALFQTMFIITGRISSVFLVQTIAELFIGLTWMKILFMSADTGSTSQKKSPLAQAN